MNTKPAVHVYPIEIQGKVGYNLKILNLDATVQDYLDALENAFLTKQFTRSRNKVSNCEGCQHCCNERISLTSIDVIMMMNFFKKHGIIPTDYLLHQFLRKYCYILIDGRSVDIYLQFRNDFCLFLSQENRCLYYPARSLVCRSFLCTPVSKAARQLREIIVNTGEDELVRLWLEELQKLDLPLNVNEAYNANPDIDDYPPNPFTGKQSYGEIKIKELCSEKIWIQLINS